VLKVAVAVQEVPAVEHDAGAIVGAAKPDVATDVKAMISFEKSPG
jgi:hypothetical protein